MTLPLGVQNGTANNTHTANYQYDALDRTTIQTVNHVNPDNTVSALNTPVASSSGQYEGPTAIGRRYR